MAIILARGNKEQCMAAFNVVNELKDDIYITNLYKSTKNEANRSVSQFKHILAGKCFCDMLSYTCLKDLKLNDYERI